MTATSSKTVSREFVLAGRAAFTVDNGRGEHYTFRVCRSRDDGRPPAWFAKVLTGPDNTSDYTYLGVLDAATGRVRLTAASRFRDDSPSVRVLRWALDIVWSGRPLPAGYAIRHEGRCGRCGRLLTVPESIESGIGPECATKLGVAAAFRAKASREAAGEPKDDPRDDDRPGDKFPAEMFAFHTDSGVRSADLSRLGLDRGVPPLIGLVAYGRTDYYRLAGRDQNASGENVYGWRYSPCGNAPGSVLIVND